MGSLADGYGRYFWEDGGWFGVAVGWGWRCRLLIEGLNGNNVLELAQPK